MLTVTCSRLSIPVKPSLVKCTLWSLLTTGLPCPRYTSSKQYTQNAPSMLLLLPQLNTLLGLQSMKATKYAKPRSKQI
jgi:hypothetical protein